MTYTKPESVDLHNAMVASLSTIQGFIRFWASACYYDRMGDLIGPVRDAIGQDLFVAGLMSVAMIVRAI